MALPAVRRTISSTASSDTAQAAALVTAAAGGGPVDGAGATSDSRLGTGAPPPSMRCHCTGSIASTAGARGSTAACNAPRPCATPMRARPAACSIAAMRALAAPRDAIPISAHAPHCTLTERQPRVTRCAARASRHWFAAL